MQTRENFIYFLLGSSTNEILNSLIYGKPNTEVFISQKGFKTLVIRHINSILKSSKLPFLTDEEVKNFDKSQQYLSYLEDKTINSY